MGRPFGSKNRRSMLDGRNLAALARTYTDAATKRIAYLMNHSTSEQVQLAAAIHLLDRGYGKPFQSVQIYEQSDVNITYKTSEELRQQLIKRGVPASMLPAPRPRIVDGNAILHDSETQNPE